MSRNFPTKTCLALCACVLFVSVAGGLRAFEGLEEATGESANQAPPDGPWQEELKKRQNHLRNKAYTVMHMAPSRCFRKLTWPSSPSEQRRVREFLKLSGDQQKLVEDLDRVTRESLNLSVFRDIQFLESLKCRPAGLDKRFMESEARRTEIAAHAEKIVLLGILAPDQAEMVKRMAWRGDRLEALRDDELAARLRLDRVQRQEIAVRLAALGKPGFREYPSLLPLPKAL